MPVSRAVSHPPISPAATTGAVFTDSAGLIDMLMGRAYDADPVEWSAGAMVCEPGAAQAFPRERSRRDQRGWSRAVDGSIPRSSSSAKTNGVSALGESLRSGELARAPRPIDRGDDEIPRGIAVSELLYCGEVLEQALQDEVRPLDQGLVLERVSCGEPVVVALSVGTEHRRRIDRRVLDLRGESLCSDHRVGEEAGHPPVPVAEGVDPYQAVMRQRHTHELQVRR